ncbi:hypothetical protein DNK34_08870 [Pseudomonas dryadis]|uniref:Uncharacterized protein n=1 Tax=Phytopseudomonas dryadis TaxID=2487520 RepID=A0A4Q9R7T2_9GAMM|nr:hypothetical protein DNK44_03400 [Pseudomonas dryadis]TBV07334.1 hypothetical protein DNK34_08870 [Pseudomonas dryadis]TBV17801.1 hypothetical protein DNK41_11660 [Pseudomonas sp. FRB 230]
MTFQRKPRCRAKSRQAGRRSARRRTPGMAFPCQVLQQRMARFFAQPRRPHPKGRARFAAMLRFSPAHLAR